ncbi:EG45-like domain containing protein [Camellia lanceoleosa]|uniref:EG45-like domain containing protein n=1 Tax=Camellia lanceoleosa TaxID=1840588 RepID=A0ACC0IFL7_9ERIC|nr:EG45-like domain containing protein [Camellia lanceoleosa]
MIAAASDAIGGKKACGRKYKVTCTGPTNKGMPHPCTGKSIVVTVVDYCPPGYRATMDLSQDAFAIVAHRNVGKINIKYTHGINESPFQASKILQFYAPVKNELGLGFKGDQKMVGEALEVMGEKEAMEIKAT